ncbi:MAG TPA: hypothetical protein VFD69_08915 [Vicinamibacterales bacterium]|nr:hypothetical protein [Vicinamibacterales bacterium]
MTRNISIIALVFPFVLLSTPSTGSADTIWSWSFDETHFVVGPTDSVVVHATVFNSPLSTEPLVKTGGASFTGDLQKTYDFEFGPEAQFLGLSLDPGDSFSFVLGTLTPISPPVPIGTYPFCCEAHLAFGSAGSSDFLPPLNTFEIEVVPEPPMWALWSVGVLPFVWRRLRAGGR